MAGTEYWPELKRFAAIKERINTNTLNSFTGTGTLPESGTLPKSGTGVSRAPYIDPYTARLLTVRGGGGGGGFGGGYERPQAPGINWDEIMASTKRPYDELSALLNQVSDQERQNIQSGASRATTFLGEMDPMAAYRPTFQSMEAPQAAMTTYLNAIGADPAQVQAQQALSNQLMANQAMNQQQFGSAVDTSQGNFRQAQVMEALLNQQRATSALGLNTGVQQAAIGMSAMQQQNAIRQMLLEAQLRLIEMQSKNSSPGLRGSMGIDIGSLGLF